MQKRQERNISKFYKGEAIVNNLKRHSLLVSLVIVVLSLSFQFVSPTKIEASMVAFHGYTYGWDPSSGGHWYVEFNVSPFKAHQHSWKSYGPRGNCDDPNIRNYYVAGKPYCTTWGAVNYVSADNLVRVGISLPNWINPQYWYGSPYYFVAYPTS